MQETGQAKEKILLSANYDPMSKCLVKMKCYTNMNCKKRLSCVFLTILTKISMVGVAEP